MNKTTRIIVIVLLLIVLGGGAYYLFGRSTMNPSQSSQIANSQNQAQMSSGKKSLADFFSMTGSLKCTFSDKTNNSSGTVNVGGGKMRGDFQSEDNGKTTQTHMINDGTYVYIWTEGQNNGYKMSLATLKSSMSPSGTTGNNGTSQQTPSQGVNMHQQSDYSCGPWTVDASTFALPQGVTFTDYSSMMQGATNGTAAKPGTMMQGNQAACSQCDQVPAGAARNQCRVALKCQ